MNSAEEYFQNFHERFNKVDFYLTQENYKQALKESSKGVYSLWFSFIFNENERKTFGEGVANYSSEDHIACLFLLTQILTKTVRCYLGLQDHRKCLFFLWNLKDVYQALGTFEKQLKNDNLIAQYQSYGEELNRYLKDPEFGQEVESLLQEISHLY